ncbi:hypothetical protein [Streptomyces sp. NRRL S-378]|uniref:hypothetical protein n=1 Tax=Streptomyces sp. NRRL S-378 TaxID=1463904 RepID=UPI001F1CA45C|nr:hypothetical protein [Streptomyces sp. NRRL S-378]
MAAVVGVMISAPPANAASTQYENHFNDTVCKDPGYSSFHFTLWYNSEFKGAYRNIGYNVWDFSDERYALTSGKQPLNFCMFGVSNPWPGSGEGVKNNAASAANRHATYFADVYYNSGYKGAKDEVALIRNLYNTKNNNASFAWRV